MRKIAGWWSDKPLGGDFALDLLGEVSRLSPQEAVRKLSRVLSSKDFGQRYAALGVWNYILNSKGFGSDIEYVEVFWKGLAPLIKSTASKLFNELVYEEELSDNEGDYDYEKLEWATPEVYKYLEGYKRAKMFSDVGYEGPLKFALLKKAKSNPLFRKKLIANLTFSLPDSDSREIEQSLADIYAAIRILRNKTRTLDPLLKRKVDRFSEDYENLRPLIMRYI